VSGVLARIVPKSLRGRYIARVALTLLPMLLLWWFAAGLVIDTLRPFARVLLQMLGLGVSLTAEANHSWIVDTGLSRASGTEAGAVLMRVPMDEMRRMTMSFPLFLALILNRPHRRPILAGAIGLLVLALVFCFSALSVVFNNIAVIINHRSSLVADSIPPPPFTVTRAPMGEFAFFCSGLSLYLGLQVLPMAAPVVTWAAVNWAGVKVLLGAGVQPDAAPDPEPVADADPA
jgi:hypothetical protein